MYCHLFYGSQCRRTARHNVALIIRATHIRITVPTRAVQWLCMHTIADNAVLQCMSLKQLFIQRKTVPQKVGRKPVTVTSSSRYRFSRIFIYRWKDCSIFSRTDKVFVFTPQICCAWRVRCSTRQRRSTPVHATLYDFMSRPHPLSCDQTVLNQRLHLSLVDHKTVASLGLVSPGAATDGVTLFREKTGDLFLVIALWKVMTFLHTCIYMYIHTYIHIHTAPKS